MFYSVRGELAAGDGCATGILPPSEHLSPKGIQPGEVLRIGRKVIQLVGIIFEIVEVLVSTISQGGVGQDVMKFPRSSSHITL